MSTQERKYRNQFESLFERYYNAIFNYVNAQLNDYESSREITQDTFLKIWNYRGKVDYESTIIKSYLYTTARNNLIDFVRKKQRQGNEKISIEQSDIDIPNQKEKHFDENLAKQAILNALKKLKPKAQKIFMLNKFEGYTYQEIADHLDISKRAVEDNIARAMLKLRSLLKDKRNLLD